MNVAAKNLRVAGVAPWPDPADLAHAIEEKLEALRRSNTGGTVTVLGIRYVPCTVGPGGGLSATCAFIHYWIAA